MKRAIHAVCKTCYKIYKNYAVIEIKKKAENTRLFVCPNCIIKSCKADKGENFVLF